MPRIISGIVSLLQHVETLNKHPESYRPERCPCCGRSGLWWHGYYYRKCIRAKTDPPLQNPIPIPRFFCPHCKKTHSVLPECIPPRRWYLWYMQQLVFLELLVETSLYQINQAISPSRSTCRRWWQQFKEQFLLHGNALRTYLSELGCAESFNDFWLACFDKISLAKAMLLCHQQGVNIP